MIPAEWLYRYARRSEGPRGAAQESETFQRTGHDRRMDVQSFVARQGSHGVPSDRWKTIDENGEPTKQRCALDDRTVVGARRASQRPETRSGRGGNAGPHINKHLEATMVLRRRRVWRRRTAYRESSPPAKSILENPRENAVQTAVSRKSVLLSSRSLRGGPLSRPVTQTPPVN
ncbi:hypothetical protein KM043_004125 [Ampulex compressa]|nr:hypothetical protein KM043_004125 [Ampulex compressa]